MRDENLESLFKSWLNEHRGAVLKVARAYWIDYNGDGVFDNATERASVTVPNGTNNGIVTLVFPAVPAGFFGKTYARFRISTDAAAANPVGHAVNGEVEDYAATIAKPSDLIVDSTKTKLLTSNTSGVPDLGADFHRFGRSVASNGDLDGDGLTNVAVGSPGRFNRQGAVYVMFMNADGTVKRSQEIANGVGGGPMLTNGDSFGTSVASVGDLNGDGLTDLAVGAVGDPTGGNHYRGAVHVLFLNTDGTVKGSRKIASNVGGGPVLADSDQFGTSVTSLGDLDGDGVSDLAVGAVGDTNRTAAIYVLFMDVDGTATGSQRIVGGGGLTLETDNYFGFGVASLGDIDGDAVTDVAVGAPGVAAGAPGDAVYVLFLNDNGTVKSSRKIDATIGGNPTG